MLKDKQSQAVVIVGAGPAGLGPLFAAASVGRLDNLLRSGVTILEQSRSLGAGLLGGYAIGSDSAAEAFLDVVMRTEEPALQSLRTHPVTEALATHRSGAAPLTLAAKFLALAGETLCRLVAQSERGRVLLGVAVASVAQTAGGRWRTRFVHLSSGIGGEVESSSVILASGAHQPRERLWQERVAGEPLLPLHAGRLLQSGDVFAHDGAARVADMLAGRSEPRVVIVGGSTSAGAVAVSLLGRMTGLRFGHGGVTILHRKPLRIFYNSADEARADGYDEFAPSDVCRLTGRVYRLGGFRFDSRDLIMRARGIGGLLPETRLRLLQLRAGEEALAQEELRKADLIIAALGYRPRFCLVVDAFAQEIPLHKPHGAAWAVVDQACRVLTRNESSLEGLFAIGLAVGPAASEELGGERDFTGQVNSLWMWQHTLGLKIVDGVCARRDGVSPVVQSPVQVDAVKQGHAPGVQEIPLIRPSPPKLSGYAEELVKIEASGVYSNYGPVSQRFEAELQTSLFGGEGHCLSVCNATLGLMLAIKQVLGEHRPAARRYALMPSFTFAAAAQAALWCGLTPLLCDIEEETWLPSAASEEALLWEYGEQVAVVVPYATFGNNLDLRRYRQMAQAYRLPIVVDAAASLGSLDAQGEQFGRGFEWPVVFSMHATKPFSTGEGGVVYCADGDRLAQLRTMGSFGFGEPRSATMSGLNSKMSEVAALIALLELRRFPAVVREREASVQVYAQALHPMFVQQRQCGERQSRAFQTVLLPRELAPARTEIMAALRERGVGSGSYFSPHLAEQPYLRQNSRMRELAVTDDVAARVLSLPLLDGMADEEVRRVAEALFEAAASATGATEVASRRSAGGGDFVRAGRLIMPGLDAGTMQAEQDDAVPVLH